MQFPRPRSLNGLILVGFGLVALPLLVAVVWALFNLDRLAEQSERLVTLGINAAENNQLLVEQLGSLERTARQHQVLRTADSLQLMKDDLRTLNNTLTEMRPLAELAGATPLQQSISTAGRRIVVTLENASPSNDQSDLAIAEFAPLRQRVTEFTTVLSAYVDGQLLLLQERTREAQRVSAWQVAALIPGTLILVLFFTLLVAKPIRQIDSAIHQLGESGFSRPIEVKGPRDLERLGRQLEWLRIRLL